MEAHARILTVDLCAIVPPDMEEIGVKPALKVAVAIPVKMEGPVKTFQMGTRVYAHWESLASIVTLSFLQPFLKQLVLL